MQRVAGVCLVLAAIVFIAWPRREAAPRVETRPPHDGPIHAQEPPRFAAVPRSVQLVPPVLHRALRVSGPGVVSGVVRDGGNLVGGATIRGVPLPLPGHLPPDREQHELEATTDDDGRYRIDDVPPGDFMLWAVFEGRASTVFTPLSVSPGETLDGVDLELVGPSIAEGIAVDVEGDRVDADVEVRLGAVRIDSGTTTQSSPFHFDALPAEPVSISASTTIEDESGQRLVEGRADLQRPATSLVLRLGLAPSSLTVEVVDDSGTPDYGAAVQLLAGNDVDNMLTDRNGVARFAHRRGKVRVVATDDSRELASDPETLELDGESERRLRVVLRSSPCARGRVLSADGTPAVGLVEIEEVETHATQLVMLDSGEYAACVGRAGGFRLSYQPLGTGHELRLVGSVDFDFRLYAGQTSVPDVRLPATRTIRGVVLDEAGVPTYGYVAFRALANGESLGTTHTKKDGTFSVQVIGSVAASATSFDGSVALTYEARSTTDEEVTLTLAQTSTVSFLLRGAPPGASARCGNDDTWADVEASGQVSLECHAGDSFNVRAGAEQHRYAISIEPGEPRYVELRWN